MPALHFNPRLRLGTKSGQVLLWDARKQQPITVPRASLQAWTRGLREGDWSHLGDAERASLCAHGMLVDTPGHRPVAPALAEPAPAVLSATLELSAQLSLVGYFNDHLRARGQRHRPLREYPPGEIEISDPFRMCELDYDAIEQYDNHQVFFELASDISRRRSAPNFVDAAQVA